MSADRALLYCLLLCTGVLPAQDPRQIELGRFLFESPSLSAGGKVSCATCHDPDRSFMDGRADSVGSGNIGIGRNSPTLIAIGHVTWFRDPDQARTARPGRRPKVLTLEQRCLAPIANELEMGGSIDRVVSKLQKHSGVKARFDRAFGGSGGVTRKRLGSVLASFVRTLEAPESPYRRYLAGEQAALTKTELGGLKIYQGKGCGDCHSGPGLSDGSMHVVDPPGGFRIKSRERAAGERHVELLRREYAKKSQTEIEKIDVRAIALEAQRMAPRLPGGGGYDASQLAVQTTTLWDVARTGPYFRDGSVPKLRDAVALHVREMNLVHEDRDAVRDTLTKNRRNGKQAPSKLRARPRPPPGRLSVAEIDDLVAFLRTLSPR